MTKAGTAVGVEEKVSSFEEKWKKLNTLIETDQAGRVAVRPESSFTPEEYGQRVGISSSHARRRLSELVSAGKLKRVKVSSRYYYLFPE